MTIIEVPYIKASDLPAWMEPYGIDDPESVDPRDDNCNMRLLQDRENESYIRDLKKIRDEQAQLVAENEEEGMRNDPCNSCVLHGSFSTDALVCCASCIKHGYD